MATALTSGGSDANSSTYTTANVSPTANALVVAGIVVENNVSGNPARPTVSGLGATWTIVEEAIGHANNRSMFVFQAHEASYTTGGVTFDFGAATMTNAVWGVAEQTDVAATPIVQSDVATAANSTSIQGTLAAFADATNNISFMVCGTNDDAQALTPEAGYTELLEPTPRSPFNGISFAFKVGEDTTPSYSITAGDGNEELALVSFEIAASGAAGNALVETPSETITISEATTRVRALNRFAAETETLAEQTIRSLQMFREVSETGEFSEQTLAILGLTRESADTESLTESVNVALGRVREVSDTEEISEAVNQVLGRVRDTSDTLSIAEAVTIALGLVRDAQDTLEIAEEALAIRAMTRIVNETMNINEAVLAPRVLVRPVGEVLELAEQVVKQAALVRTLADSLSISEGTAKVLPEQVTAIIDLTMPARSLDLTMPSRSSNLGATFPLSFPAYIGHAIELTV